MRRYIIGSLVVTVTMAAVGVLLALALARSTPALVGAGALGAVAGLVASILAYGVLQLLENGSGPSDLRLLELASPGHPLLKRLMLDAPGTYSHSVLTGHLAENAAEAIGADPLLTRVGAYYHDIGKLHRPEYFCENLDESPDPHNETAPKDSADIITAHVTDGLALARAYGLPEQVRAIIGQHHGTSVVSYFYDKARATGEPVEADFRYAGERPASREAALVMLADAAEAAVRCIRTPTLPRVEGVVCSVIDQRIADHQLDDAGLSPSDLEKVVRVYARMLMGMSHPRVEYPARDTGEEAYR